MPSRRRNRARSRSVHFGCCEMIATSARRQTHERVSHLATGGAGWVSGYATRVNWLQSTLLDIALVSEVFVPDHQARPKHHRKLKPSGEKFYQELRTARPRTRLQHTSQTPLRDSFSFPSDFTRHESFSMPRVLLANAAIRSSSSCLCSSKSDSNSTKKTDPVSLGLGSGRLTSRHWEGRANPGPRPIASPWISTGPS